MHVDVGTLIWVGIVLFGVISSIVRSARRAVVRTVPRATARPAAPATVPKHVLETVHGAAPPPVVVVAPPPAPVAAPVTPTEATPPEIVRRAAPVLHGTVPRRGMFERRADLVRAVVAAQVLGPPKALQEQSIWSPRHDASI